MNSQRRTMLLWLLLFLIVVIAAILEVARRTALQRAVSITCVSHFFEVIAASRHWAKDHQGQFPANFQVLSNDLHSPAKLFCPADRLRKRAANWSTFTASNCSYEIVSPGIHVGDTNSVFFRCPIHGHRAYTDGTGFGEVRSRHQFFD
jgi:hypothetical protein